MLKIHNFGIILKIKEMKEILKEFCPTGKVLGINPHKLGPVHAVQQIQDHLNEYLAIEKDMFPGISSVFITNLNIV